MKVKMPEQMDDLIGHIVVEGLTKALGTDKGFTKFINRHRKKEGFIFDLKLTVNNEVEIDLENLVEHWEKQMDRRIEEEALELVNDRVDDIDDIFSKLSEELKNGIDTKIKEWKKKG